MIILSNCLTDTVDEGCIKVANSLTRWIKNFYPNTTVISCGQKTDKSDIHLDMNPLFLNASLARILRRKKEQLLYIPFSSNTMASILRLCVLKLMNPEKVTALFALKHPMNHLSKCLLKLSGAHVLALSRESFHFYQSLIGQRAAYLKTGVDAQQFVPVDQAHKRKLREKYGIPADKCVVLHVGHLSRGRNVACMCTLDDACHGLLVLSSATRDQRDPQLQQMLAQCENLTILDQYLPDIQQIYQLADVYLFPVQEKEACIDLPLSVLEAAACGIPVVCTPYGELKEFRGEQGFYFLETLAPSALNNWIRIAAAEDCTPRSTVLEYDWNLAAEKIINGV